MLSRFSFLRYRNFPCLVPQSVYPVEYRLIAPFYRFVTTHNRGGIIFYTSQTFIAGDKCFAIL